MEGGALIYLRFENLKFGVRLFLEIFAHNENRGVRLLTGSAFQGTRSQHLTLRNKEVRTVTMYQSKEYMFFSNWQVLNEAVGPTSDFDSYTPRTGGSHGFRLMVVNDKIS